MLFVFVSWVWNPNTLWGHNLRTKRSRVFFFAARTAHGVGSSEGFWAALNRSVDVACTGGATELDDFGTRSWFTLRWEDLRTFRMEEVTQNVIAAVESFM